MSNEIHIYGNIGTGEGEISAAAIRSELSRCRTNQEIVVRIDSYGGEVLEGFKIYDALRSFKGRRRVVVDGSAMSIASYIAMAGDVIEITPSAYMMLHDPHVEIEGTAADLKSNAELLESMESRMLGVYSIRSGNPPEAVRKMMRSETFLTGQAAVDAGFADTVVDPTLAYASASAMSRWKAAIESKIALCNGDRWQAIKTVERTQPLLRKAVVAEANRGRRPR